MAPGPLCYLAVVIMLTIYWQYYYTRCLGPMLGYFFGVCSADVSRPSSRFRRPLVAGHIHVRPVGHTAREVAVAHLLLHTVW